MKGKGVDINNGMQGYGVAIGLDVGIQVPALVVWLAQQ